MMYIALIAVIGILLLQATGSIPLASVGGSMTIGLAYLVAALAVGIHEAWTQKRGVLGWIVNIVVSFVGALVAAPSAAWLLEYCSAMGRGRWRPQEVPGFLSRSPAGCWSRCWVRGARCGS
jgi:hypothetical protein